MWELGVVSFPKPQVPPRVSAKMIARRRIGQPAQLFLEFRESFTESFGVVYLNAGTANYFCVRFIEYRRETPPILIYPIWMEIEFDHLEQCRKTNYLLFFHGK